MLGAVEIKGYWIVLQRLVVGFVVCADGLLFSDNGVFLKPLIKKVCLRMDSFSSVVGTENGRAGGMVMVKPSSFRLPERCWVALRQCNQSVHSVYGRRCNGVDAPRCGWALFQLSFVSGMYFRAEGRSH